MFSESKSLKGVKVGDTVVVPRYDRTSRVNSGQERVVTRVGRTLIYIREHGREIGFYIEVGSERSDYQPRWAYLPDEWEKEQRHVKVMARLRDEYKIGPTGYSNHVSPEAWSEILEVLDRHAGKD